jgi:hypothetical protein
MPARELQSYSRPVQKRDRRCELRSKPQRSHSTADDDKVHQQFAVMKVEEKRSRYQFPEANDRRSIAKCIKEFAWLSLSDVKSERIDC